jgi:hypothetical protein
LAIRPRVFFWNHPMSRLSCSGVASSYVWVAILLYCLWLNEHIYYFLTKIARKHCIPITDNGLLSLQETLRGCRPEVLGNLRNKCFLYFSEMDQWDNSIQLIAFRHQSDKQINSALQDWLNSKVALSGWRKDCL